MLSSNQKLLVLTDIFGTSYKVGNEHLFFCPRCSHHKKKLSVNLIKNRFKCWICGYSGSDVGNLVKHYGNADNRNAWGLLANNVDFSLLPELFAAPKKEEYFAKSVALPQDFRTLCGSRRNYSSRIPYNYLTNRGLLDEDIYRWKIGYCSSGPYTGYIIVPSFNRKGQLNFFVARAYKNDAYPNYRMPHEEAQSIIFNELFLDFRKPIVLVEGVFDAIKAGENSVPVLGSQFTRKRALFAEIVKNRTPVLLVFDKDAKTKERKVASLLMSYGVDVRKIELGKYGDVGEMSKEEFQRRKTQSKMVSNISTLEDLAKTI